MSLDKVGLKAAIVAILTAQANNINEAQTPAQAIENYAEGISDAIDIYVKTGIVNTVGNQTNQSGRMT